MKYIILIFASIALLTGCHTPAAMPPSAEVCGPKPAGYEMQVKQIITADLTNATSATLEFLPPVPGWGPSKENCWVVKVWCNVSNAVTNSMREPYWFYYSDNKLIGQATPKTVPVADWPKANALRWTW